MTSKTSHSKALLDLSSAVGDFIRYWGFRRIHGQIWTQIYLSRTPLSATELTKRLKVSKALVSPALSELEGHELILQSGGNAKTKLYTANPDVLSAIHKVLQSREKKLIERAEIQQRKVQAEKDPNVDPERLESLAQMIDSAQTMVELMLKFSQPK